MSLSRITNFLFNDKRGAVLVIFVLAAVSIFGINQYRFGWSDHTSTIPFLKSFLNPALYPNDYLLTQIPYYYTFLWFGLGAIIKYFGVGIPTAFFLVYAFSIFTSLAAIYLIAMELFAKREVAYLALFFSLFAGITLSGAASMEDMLITKTAVLPILLFSIYFFLKGNYVVSYLLQGIGFLVHPLTALYTLAMILAASAVMAKKIGIKKIFLSILFFSLASASLLIWKFLYSPESLHLLYAEPAWIELLKLRSSHHIFPFSWGLGMYIKTMLVITVFVAGCKYRPRSDHQKTVWAFVAAIGAMVMAGVIFAEIFPLSIILNVQPARSFQFFTYLAAIYFANYLIVESELRPSASDKLFLALGSLAFFYDTRTWEVAYFSLAAFAAFVSVFYLAMPVARVFRQAYAITPRHIMTAVLALAVVLAGAAYVAQGGFSIGNAQSKEWLGVQKWAKENTNVNSLFITPPSIEGFRVESERAIYGDWKDGTLMNFNPSFGYEWMRRMKRLGYKTDISIEESYNKLSEKDFRAIAAEEDRASAYIVRQSSGPALNLPVAFTNNGFVVYMVEL